MLAECLHRSLVGTLPGHSGGAGSSTLSLLQVLSTTKASLRCLELAAASGLQLSGSGFEDGVRCFVQKVLCTSAPSGAHADAPACTALQLLWRLAVQHNGLNSVAARKACDILLWALAPPVPGLRHILLGPLAAACSAAELTARLSAACRQQGAALADKHSLMLHRQHRAAAIFSWVRAGSRATMHGAAGAALRTRDREPTLMCFPRHAVGLAGILKLLFRDCFTTPLQELGKALVTHKELRAACLRDGQEAQLVALLAAQQAQQQQQFTPDSSSSSSSKSGALSHLKTANLDALDGLVPPVAGPAGATSASAGGSKPAPQLPRSPLPVASGSAVVDQPGPMAGTSSSTDGGGGGRDSSSGGSGEQDRQRKEQLVKQLMLLRQKKAAQEAAERLGSASAVPPATAASADSAPAAGGTAASVVSPRLAQAITTGPAAPDAKGSQAEPACEPSTSTPPLPPPPRRASNAKAPPEPQPPQAAQQPEHFAARTAPDTQPPGTTGPVLEQGGSSSSRLGRVTVERLGSRSSGGHSPPAATGDQPAAESSPVQQLPESLLTAGIRRSQRVLHSDDQLSRLESGQYGAWADAAEAAYVVEMADASGPPTAAPVAAAAPVTAAATAQVACTVAAAHCVTFSPNPAGMAAARSSRGGMPAGSAVVGSSSIEPADSTSEGDCAMTAQPSAAGGVPAVSGAVGSRGGTPASPEAADRLQAFEELQLRSLSSLLSPNLRTPCTPSRRHGEVQYTPSPHAQMAAGGQPFPAAAVQPAQFVPWQAHVQAPAAGAANPADSGWHPMHSQLCLSLSADDMDVDGGPEAMEH